MFKLSNDMSKEIISLARTVKSTADQSVDNLNLHVIVDKTSSRELVMALKDLLKPLSYEVTIEVDELYEVQPHRAIPSRDLAFIVCGSEAERAAEVASSYSQSHIPSLIVCDESSVVPPAQSVRSLSEAPVSLLRIGDLSELSGKLEHWILDQDDEMVQKFVKVFGFVRGAYFNKLIANCAKENALVALMPLNKADMPLMTLNTVKMASQMSWVLGRRISVQTVGEMACVMGSGYLMRYVARLLPHPSKGTKTAVDVAVSYAGTVACGKVLKNYYQLTEKYPLKVPILR